MRRIQAQLFNPTYTKAPEKNTNSNEDLRSHQQTPTIAAFDPTWPPLSKKILRPPQIWRSPNACKV
jgi:hypothetical protein